MLTEFLCLSILALAPCYVDGLRGPCSLDAATTWLKNGKLYLFRGKYYARWIDSDDKVSIAKPIYGNWKGIPDDVDAATSWGNKNYFFKGCQYWRYYQDESSSGPHDIASWKIPCHIDAAATWAGKTYFFKGNRFWRWNGDSFSGPSSISNWDKLEGYLDAGVQWNKNGKTYFLKGKKYWVFESTGNSATIKSTSGGWTNLLDSDLMPNCPCDCNSCCNGNWKVDSVQYDLKAGSILSLPPIEVATKTIDNLKGTAEQKLIFMASRSVTETESFSHEVGVTVTVGTEFKTKIPFIAEGKISLEVSTSYNHQWGKEKSTTKRRDATFECTGPPKTKTKCVATLHYQKMKVPYTMIWKHKTKGCTCTSRGTFMKTSSTQMSLRVTETKYYTTQKHFV